MNNRTSNQVLISLILITVTLAVYMQVGNYQFLNIDDYIYVSDPHVTSGVTINNIVWAFTGIDNFYLIPVTWVSHMAVVHAFGIDPRYHHLANVFIHTASALLLYILLLRLTGALWPSSLVAFIFALHPLNVEAVAWVASRKDVLSSLFCFLTLLFYSEYVVKQNTLLYLLALLSFVLGLMSKPILVTLPIVMLLLDYWPMERHQYPQGQCLGLLSNGIIPRIKEKIPFFACILISAANTFYAHHKEMLDIGINDISFGFRIKNALVAYSKYLGKIVWPNDLAFYYPLPISIPLWQVIISLFILILLCTVAIRARNRLPYVTVGWFWFLVTLLPVLGLTREGNHVAMADRYTYLPGIGLFITAAWGTFDITKRWQHQQAILALLAGAIIITSTVLTWRQLCYWQDSITLYRQTLLVTTDNDFIHANLGAALAHKGDFDAAIQEFREALRIKPNDSNNHIWLGVAFAKKGNFDAAIKEYSEALKINTNDATAHYNLGTALVNKGHLDAAIIEFREALRINPNDVDAQKDLELVLNKKGT